MRNNVDEIISRAVRVVPSKRQLLWQSVEYYNCIRFGMNTFTDSEWGSGGESPELFNPAKLDAGQWLRVCKATESRGVVLDVKHADGFCLWPSAVTQHTVASSPWRGGEGDLVREVSDACRKSGLKFGIAISLTDRHEPSFGTADYDKFFKAQLHELLTGYGEIFCVRLENMPDGVKLDLDGYYEVIRSVQPDAVISACGPDVRWCGNDRGVCRSSEWSVVPSRCVFNPNSNETGKKKNVMELDLGSRKAIKGADKLVWSPAEVAVPFHDGNFYHEREDYSLKPLVKLMGLYFSSVGGNAALMLGLCPTKDGLISERDIDTLVAFGAQLSIEFNENLAEDSVMTASCRLDEAHDAQKILSHDQNDYWHSGENPDRAELILDMGDEYDINKVVLGEHIATGQQIEEFTLYGEIGGKWKKLAEGTTIGYKCICRFREVRMQRIKLIIEKTRYFATIAVFETY